MRQNILKEIVVLVRMVFSFFVSLSLYSFFCVLSISFLGFFFSSYFKIPPGGTMGGNDDALNANKKKEKKGRQMFFAGYLNPSTAACWIVILCPPLSLFIDLTLLKPDTYVFSPFLCTQFFFPSYQLPKSDSVHQQTFSDL